MSAYNRYNDQSRSRGLPGDEYSRLYKRDRLNTHFEHRGNRDAPFPEPTRSAYRDAGLSQESRVRVSESRNATRAALGSSFDFTDEGYERSRRREDDYQRSRGWIDDQTRRAPIPQKYQDEFYRLWNEDDTERSETSYATSRNDSGYGSSGSRRPRTPSRLREPELVSRFSFESIADSYKSSPRRRRYQGLFGRNQM